jgi:hypothetical protein
MGEESTNAQAALQAAATTFSTVGAWASAEGGHAITRRAEVFKQWLDKQEDTE